MATPREQLAELLRQARLDAGFGSHGALARKLNVSRPVVTRAENPAHPVPSDAVLAAWAGATGAGLAIAAEGAADVAAYAESNIQGAVYTDSDLIARANRVFDGLRADALPWTQTEDLLRKAGERWTL